MKKAFEIMQSWAAILALGLLPLATAPGASAQTNSPVKADGASTNSVPAAASATPASGQAETNAPSSRIRDEGMNRSQVMETLSYLTDVIGPRLTGSSNLKHANEWTRTKLESWGLTNAALEAWGPFGRGWELKRFSAQVIEPQAIPLKAYPAAWSPGFDKPVEAEVVYFDAKTDADLEKYKGKLKGAIVLMGAVREVKARFEPLATRMVETNLLELANADVPSAAGGFNGPGGFPRRQAGGGRPADGVTNNSARFGGGTNGVPPRRGPRGPRFLGFLAKEGAAMVLTPSSQGDGGTIFVASASAIPPDGQSTNPPADVGGFGGRPRIAVYATNAPATLPQITVAVEDYNRLVRMAQFGEKMKMAVDLQVKFLNDDLMCYNTVAEISGTDLKNEVVMLGGHMDSWQSGTGATDNGAGVAAAMEAVRIIKALDLKPRRTIRVALWSGEEEGLLGSKAYVSKHFGYYTNITETDGVALRSPRAQSDEEPAAMRQVSNRTRPDRKLIRGNEYEKLSAYFNLDNGGGKIRGIYMQGNEAVRPLFRKWLEPFRDLGAETLTPSNTGSTDHVSFDTIGLPGFQFIQDTLEYNTRTHHSNEDVFDRIQADDMKQASVIMAAFVYDAAMMDEKIPRKPVD
ncbi:MAG: lieA [Pedosphaera sp.]|nr:lieA [Pedosphaera sp.]